MTGVLQSLEKKTRPSTSAITVVSQEAYGCMTDRAASWLEGRGIDPELASRIGIVSVTQRDGSEWIAFPYVKDGEVINRKYRSLDRKDFRMDPGRPQAWFNGDVITDKSLEAHPLVVTEGEIDAVIAIQCGFVRAVSVPGGAPSTVGCDGNAKYAFIADTLDDLRGTREVILAVDGDKPGMNLMHDISIRIGRGRCKYVTYPDGCKDLNDVYRDYGSAGVSDVLNNSRWCHVPGLFIMSELPPVPFVKPYDTLINGLSDHYRIRKCDFTVVTGVPGSGKSTFVNDIASRMAWNHGWRTCFASFEQHPQIDHRRALRTWHSKKLEKYMASDEIAAADKWIDQFFSFVVQEEDADADLEWLLDKLASAVIRFGADICVIDPWNEMDHALPNGQSQTDYIGYAIRQLKKFARKWNVHVIVVAHPAKLLRDKEGKMPIPSLYDINGSANWANKCDVGIIVHNCSTEEDGEHTIIRVAKTRYRDQIGVPGDVPVRFDRDTSRFVAL